MRINVLMKQDEIAHRQMRDDAYLVSGSCASLLRARARANKRPRGCRAVVRMRCNLSDDEQRVKDARWREEGRINRKRAGDHPSLSLALSRWWTIDHPTRRYRISAILCAPLSRFFN